MMQHRIIGRNFIMVEDAYNQQRQEMVDALSEASASGNQDQKKSTKRKKKDRRNATSSAH